MSPPTTVAASCATSPDQGSFKSMRPASSLSNPVAPVVSHAIPSGAVEPLSHPSRIAGTMPTMGCVSQAPAPHRQQLTTPRRPGVSFLSDLSRDTSQGVNNLGVPGRRIGTKRPRMNESLPSPGALSAGSLSPSTSSPASAPMSLPTKRWAEDVAIGTARSRAPNPGVVSLVRQPRPFKPSSLAAATATAAVRAAAAAAAAAVAVETAGAATGGKTSEGVTTVDSRPTVMDIAVDNEDGRLMVTDVRMSGDGSDLCRSRDAMMRASQDQLRELDEQHHQHQLQRPQQCQKGTLIPEPTVELVSPPVIEDGARRAPVLSREPVGPLSVSPEFRAV